MRILTVDDDPIFLELVRSELSELGYHDVDQVGSGQEALRLVKRARVPYDCFLLDVEMPEIDGIRLCGLLRDEPSTRGIPIFMVTTVTNPQSVDRAFAAGASDYLNKPLNRRELRGRLRMAKNLARERSVRQAVATSMMEHAFLKIEDPVTLNASSTCVDYAHMQNYAFKLGAMQLMKKTVVGVHVANIRELFTHKDVVGFKESLTDVAAMIAEAFGPDHKMLSYAGSGNFIVLLHRGTMFRQSAIATALRSFLPAQMEKYGATGEAAPRLKLGKPVNYGPLSFADPEKILAAAADYARRDGMEIWRDLGTGSEPTEVEMQPTGS
ncbi:response regulator [Aestuariivita sp.]|uniref:response regulator n=1 Tax=Aestuariivita sp. TaxID=1872407 RepID=UPI00216BA9FB|nr:response regulator [Aestuariivita sp.]MCE8006788.1 response regulator [Aestuariivita sp.]